MTATETYKIGARSGVGVSSQRPDAVPKATGEFPFSSDLSSHNMLWGKTLRSPYPSARIRNIDYSEALAISGVQLNACFKYKTNIAVNPLKAIKKIKNARQSVLIDLFSKTFFN